MDYQPVLLVPFHRPIPLYHYFCRYGFPGLMRNPKLLPLPERPHSRRDESMVCEECQHSCTGSDFLTLRNLCDHLYLDALAKRESSLEEEKKLFAGGKRKSRRTPKIYTSGFSKILEPG